MRSSAGVEPGAAACPRTLPRRLLNLSLAALFLLAAGGEAYGYHECPHHDALPDGGSGRTSHAGGEPDRSSTHEQNAGSAEHAGHDGPCACVGLCHGSAAAPLPGAAPPSELIAASPATARVSFETGDALPNLLPYVLPYANGPPPGI